MKRKPNVRYRAAQNNSPEAPQASLLDEATVAASKLDSASLRKVMNETSEKIFEDIGGKSLERRLAQLERSLDVYDQDLERTMTHEDPDRFRWRIKPAEAVRIGREIDGLRKQITELREGAWKTAGDILKEFMQQPEPQAESTQPEPEAHKVESTEDSQIEVGRPPDAATRDAA